MIPDPTEPAGTAATAATAATAQPRILVINHSPEVLALIRILLEEDHFRVTTQSHLDHDLDAIAAMMPDLVILDYPWSSDDNRWTLLQLLRMDRRTVRIPIVLCTAAVREVDALQGHLERMDVAVVLKPFDIDHLLRVIRDSLDGASQRRPVIMLD